MSGLLQGSSNSRSCLVLAHGAGAGMHHPFMAAVANELAALGIATLRYQFPYMEKGGKRPDPPKLCHATVRAAVNAAEEFSPGLPLFAGGKSFGARMTSQAQALTPLPNIRGLAFFGFPLHPPQQPAIERASHLLQVKIPMLFLQGTRDEFARLDLLQATVKELGEHATLKLYQGVNHSFHAPAKSGQSDIQIRAEMLTAFAAWADKLAN